MTELGTSSIPVDSNNELIIVEKEEIAQAHEGGYEWAINLIAEPDYDSIPRYESLDLPSLDVHGLTPRMAIVRPKEKDEPVYVQAVGPENEDRTYARFEGDSLEALVDSLIEENFLLEDFEGATEWLVSSVVMPESVPDNVLSIVQERRKESMGRVTELEP